jgi:hypothetical protein
MGKNVTISTLPNIGQNYLPKINTSNIFANSLVYDNGTNVILNGTTTHTDYSNARLVVNNSSNSYIEIRSTGGQSALALTTATSTSSNFPTVEIFNSANFGIVGYRPGVVSSNYIMYYELGSSTNRRLTFQTEGVNRLIINQDGTSQFTSALSGTSATFTLANDITLTARSGSASAYTYWSLGRTSSELEIGVAGAANQFFTGTAAGDVIIKANGSSNKLFLGYGSGSPTLTLLSTGAATFSSSITAASGLFNGYTSGLPASTGSASRGGLRLNNASNIAFDFGTVATGSAWIQISDAGNYASNFPLLLNPNGGNVGIGTSSPSYPLTIGANFTNAGTLSSGGNLNGSAYFGQGGLTVGVQSTTSHTALFTNSTNKDILFGCWDGSTNSEKMRITSGGAVGIGTSSPSGSDWNASATLLHIYQNSTNGALLKLESSNAKGMMAVGNDQMQFGTISNDPLILYTNSSPRMTITSGGNVLVGTTSDSGSKLRVSGNLQVNGFQRIVTYNIAVSANTTGTITITSPTGTSMQGTMMVQAGGYGNSLSGNVTGLWMASGLLFFNDPSTTTITQIVNSVTANGSMTFARSGANYTVSLVNTSSLYEKSFYVSVIITGE